MLVELHHEGYVMDVERTWDGGGYEYPAPTEKGPERLREGGSLVEDGGRGILTTR